MRLSELAPIAFLAYNSFDAVKGFPFSLPSSQVNSYRETYIGFTYSRLAASSEDRCDEGTLDISSEWTMEEDWALIDNLPKFTISTATETKTFWTQLWSSNPILFSTKKLEDLQERAQKLQKEREKEDGKGLKRDLSFGSSPSVLENWKLDSEQHKNIIVGQINDINSGSQRTIWFHYHSIGRLGDDPWADQSSTVLSLLPGGYIEAIGGRIYELGQPAVQEERVGTRETVDRNDATSNKSDPDVAPWWLPSGTAALSAFVSSTILSACIGYGAGLSIVQDGSNHHHRSIQQPPAMLSPSQSTLTTPSKTSDPNALPSIEERRAKAQYRVLMEERLLKKISQRLEVDKENLKQLDEQMQQSSKLLP